MKLKGRQLKRVRRYHLSVLRRKVHKLKEAISKLNHGPALRGAWGCIDVNKQMTPITEQVLLDNGYQKKIFFFQIGNYEDEDDIMIFVKDGIAVTMGSDEKYWHARKLDDISYAEGFDTDNTVTIMFLEDINKGQ